MSGQHCKPTLFSQHWNKIKTAGGALAGAALAGGIAASAAVATPATGQAFAPQAALADVAAIGAVHQDLGTAEMSAHERHLAHTKHLAGMSRSSGKEAGKDASSESSGSAPHKASHGSKEVTPADVIKVAESQVGNGENGSGVSKFNKWFMKDPRAASTVKRDGGSLGDYKDGAWCDMFVSWVGNKLGINDTLGFDAYTVKHAEWFKDHGRWGNQPKPGAVTFFSWTGDKIDDIEHVGFTIKDNHDGTITTVEGNTENTVAVRTRDKSDVVGYGYPDYRK